MFASAYRFGYGLGAKHAGESLMWMDDDFPAMLKMENPDFRAYAEAEQTKRFQRVEERKEKAAREFAQLSAQHPVTGYDRNVMQQWIEAGACGKRPRLSFELQEMWISEEERELRERTRQLELEAERLHRQAAAAALRRTKACKAEKVAVRLAGWDAEHPAEAEKRGRRKQLVQQRRAAEKAEREQKLKDEALRRSIHRRVNAGPGGLKERILQLDEEEFRIWSEGLATIEQLELFGQELFNDGKKLREADGPLLWRLFRQWAEAT